MELDGTTAFVTGASRGIGKHIAIAMGEAGANVALAARSDGIKETAARLPEENVLPIRTDVSDESSISGSIERTVETFGGLDCLVNNAGVAGPTAPVEEIAKDDFERTLEVNLVGAFVAAKHAIPHLRTSARGSVINIGSISGKRPYTRRSPYSASKAGLIGFSRTLSHELAGDGVRVNTITPGPVTGQRSMEVFEARAREAGTDPATVRSRLESNLPMGEMVEPREIADLAVFLASDEAPHLTSQDISVSSGFVWW